MGKSNRETQRFYLRTKVVPANNGPSRNGPRENAVCWHSWAITKAELVIL